MRLAAPHDLPKGHLAAAGLTTARPQLTGSSGLPNLGCHEVEYGQQEIVSMTAASRTKAWDVFVAYASEDRSAVAQPLVERLEECGLRVWYDRMELRVGDRVREKIDEGLAKCRYGVLILSPSFFTKAYTRTEFAGLFHREQVGRDLILPVWHEVTARDVQEFSPPLVDRWAARSADGILSVVDQLLGVIDPDLRMEIRQREAESAAAKAKLPLITSGVELTRLFSGVDGLLFHSEKPPPDEIELIAQFEEDLQDCIDIWSEMRPSARARASNHVDEKLNEICNLGWKAAGRVLRRTLGSGGVSETLSFAVIVLMRSDTIGALSLDDSGRVVIVRQPRAHESERE